MVEHMPHIFTVDTASNGSVNINTSSWIKVVNSNPNRHFLIIANIADKLQAFINLCPLGMGVDETGICLEGGSNFEMPVNAIYKGEICAKAATAPLKLVFVEY
jgi:hypothetical protein